MNTYKYKDDILERLKEYNPILKENSHTIEIMNNTGESLYIDLEDEIIISYGNWHVHHHYEDNDDYKEALKEVENILTNKECIITIISNNKILGSGSTLNKEKYTEEEALEFINSFFKNTYHINYGVNIKVNYWDSSKNYELYLDK